MRFGAHRVADQGAGIDAKKTEAGGIAVAVAKFHRKNDFLDHEGVVEVRTRVEDGVSDAAVGFGNGDAKVLVENVPFVAHAQAETQIAPQIDGYVANKPEGNRMGKALLGQVGMQVANGDVGKVEEQLIL